jgi:hypothetical protein
MKALLISIIGIAAFSFFVTFNIKIAEINKDISFLYTGLDDTAQKIEKISDELSSFRSDLKSLDSKFALFIELFKQGGNSMSPDKTLPDKDNQKELP